MEDFAVNLELPGDFLQLRFAIDRHGRSMWGLC
jgi:hypothetical protein